jgi:predicted Rossmann-fold nucleotide-binding protein
MEATHLGAWMADREQQELDDALQTMAVAPGFKDAGWLDTAFKVMGKYPQTTYASVGIPTWLYGHEPSTPFATHIAKFFENSIREDSILTLAYGGIIYTPGSAGTLQEIFQDAVQNHYLSFGFSSPMIFLGKDFWTKEIPIYSLLESLMQNGKYKNLILTVSDESKEIVAELMKFREKMKDFNQ